MALVFTNDKCIGCNKCIRACSCTGANISVTRDGKTRVDVDEQKCIACGACFDVCEHKAREFTDDTARFFADLRRGEKISILVAPAFRANYPNDYEQVFGALKQAGVQHIISVAFGADITTWGYLNYILNHDFQGGISQPCPAVVGYIERYLPELLPRLFPIQSPLMCAAIYAKKYMHITDKLAFISPCIAKKLEIEDENNQNYVTYNVTFDHLMQYLRANQIKGSACADEIAYGLGSVYPTPGGLKENVSWFLGDDILVRQMEGEKRMYHYLEKNKAKLAGGQMPFLFLDALNCEAGCIYGTGIEPEKASGDGNLHHLFAIRAQSRKKGRKGAWAKGLTPKQRLRRLNQQFAKLDLKDFIRQYTDRSAQCKYRTPDRASLEKIYLDMGKQNSVDRSINCSCCGYETCEEMAVAIYNGFSSPVNCIYYLKQAAEKEHQRALAAADEVNAQKQLILQSVEQINQQFVALYGSVEQMSQGNEINASESAQISAEMQQVSEFCVQMNQSITQINQLLKEMETNNGEVVSIASETNLLSLNASVEAARAGAAGKGFSVVAESIKRLAEESKRTVQDSGESQAKIEKAISAMRQDGLKLVDTVGRVNGRTQSLAASTQQIAASVLSIIQVSDEIKDKLKLLTES